MSSREPAPGASEGVPDTGDRGRAEATGRSRRVVAVGLGFLGIVVFGIGLGLLAAILGGIAGAAGARAGRSFELAYLALLLAAVDGVVWIVMQMLFQLPIFVG